MQNVRPGWCAAMCILFLYAVPLAAENGVPVDVLQENPYFTNGTIENDGTHTGRSSGGQSQYTDDHKQFADPDDPETFYNAENWTGGGGSPQQPELPSAIQAPAPVGLRKSTQVHIAGGYMAFFAPSLAAGSIPDSLHLQKIFYINALGAALRGEYLNWELPFGYGGFGLNATWSYILDKEEYYTLRGHYFTANIFYALKILLNEYNALEIHGGGGGMLMRFPQFSFENGAEPETFWWLYPQAMLGAGYEHDFSDTWSIDVYADVVWPFLLSIPFPQVQLTVAAGWRL